METLVNALMNQSGIVPYLVIFVILLFCGFGLPVPEDIVLFAAGLLAYYQKADVYVMLAVTFAGVMIGDSTVFTIGALYGKRLRRKAWVKRFLPPERMRMVRRKLHAQGNKVIFAARFMPGLRTPVFFTCGTLHLPFRVFFFYDGLAALIFSYSRSSIEKIENGRGKLTPERVRKFVEGYGFTQNQFMDLKLGRLGDVAPVQIEPKKVRIIEHVEMRRSYKKIITKEVRTLAIFRKRKGVSQYEASELCGYCKPTIGHIEQGRIELTEERIKHIVTAYGRTMKEFYEAVRSDIMRDDLEVECVRLIQRLDDTRLVAIKAVLEKF